MTELKALLFFFVVSKNATKRKRLRFWLSTRLADTAGELLLVLLGAIEGLRQASLKPRRIIKGRFQFAVKIG